MEYYPFLSKGRFMDWLMQSECYQLRRYVRLLRSEEYYAFVKPSGLRRLWYKAKKNRLGVKLGFVIPAGCFGTDLKIWHYGSVIVNPRARIGAGCTLHGNCCIGNRGDLSEHDSPVIGEHVDIGQGAQVLGPVKVADNVKIGAGAVVVKDIITPGATAVGIPAKTL